MRTEVHTKLVAQVDRNDFNFAFFGFKILRNKEKLNRRKLPSLTFLALLASEKVFLSFNAF